MNRRLVIPVLALTLLGGCIVHTPPRRHVVVKKERRCHPSEYWDGDRCVHKGKGKKKKKKHKDRDRDHGRHRHHGRHHD